MNPKIKKVQVSPKKQVEAKPLNLASTDILNLLASKFQAFEAQVDPEYLQKLSTLVEKTLEAKKDTEDYNMNLVSQVIDKAVRVFMEGGQEALAAGDYIKIQERILSNLESKDFSGDFATAVETGTYETFPFSQSVEAELRSIFLLQTSKKDTYKNLMEQFSSLQKNFFKGNDFDLVQKAMAQANERLSKNLLMFPAPPEGREQGVLRPLTNEEIKEFNLTDNLMVDERFDNHDLLALKDLVLMMKGKHVHPLSIGPSFFAKYMPEFKSLGIDGVVLKVVADKLVSITLAKLPVGNMRYSPVEAASILFFTDYVKYKEVPASENNINSKAYEITDFDAKVFKDNVKYFVVNDGCVAIPSSKVPYDYEVASKNDTRLPAGEVFLFEKMEGKVVQTRIGFVPYNYSQLHIFHQHGSLIYGSNDQSFQSCYKDPRDFAEDTINDYKLWWRDLVKNSDTSQGDAFSPAVVASRLHYFLKNSEGKVSEGAEIFKEENKKALELAMHSVSEQTEFTKYWTLHTLHYYHMIYTYSVRNHIADLCKYEAPLSRRWLAKTYVENGSGLTLEKQPTFFIKLAKELEANKNASNLEFYLKLKEVENRVSKGLDKDEAIAQVFSFDVAEEVKKLKK